MFFGKALEARPDPKLAVNYCHVNADCTDRLPSVFGDEPFAGRFNIGYWAWELDEFPPPGTGPPISTMRSGCRRRSFSRRLPRGCGFPSSACPIASASASRLATAAMSSICRTIARSSCACSTGAVTSSGRIRRRPSRRSTAPVAAGRDPLLVIKAARADLDRGLANRLRKKVKYAECHILESWLSREETLSLIAACDMLVSLHRSEGFGLILAEAMALGKPVVATGYSGNMDFMNAMNSFPVDYKLTTLKKAVGPYPAGARWADPDIEHAAHLIGEALDHPRRARQIGRQAAEDIARDYSLEAVAETIRKRFAIQGFTFAAPGGAATSRPQHDPDRKPMLVRRAA